ncbi:MAG TPA: 16S rRNA (cytosine(1402)-N(4))-methyltransferase, partial [Methylomirabilota bacterium]|nr:16S rRNA (cytosine(1402)-N(4))-methyltransferase [Methylomirabilota bacterium]
MRRKRYDRGNRQRNDRGALAGRGAAEGEPSAFEREASGSSRNEPDHVAAGHVAPEHAAAAHVPVLLDEVTFLLRPRRGGWVVDGTIGMGGHAEQFLETAADSHLLGIDRDPEALARAARRLERFGARVVLSHGSFRHLRALATKAGVERAATVLLDLGLSSYQLDESGRGFSFHGEEPLDMRFDPTTGPTAAELLARLPAEELAGLLAEYGEERRVPLKYEEIPEQMKQAILAAEDDRFFQHPGVDWEGLARAAFKLVTTGEKGPGG